MKKKRLHNLLFKQHSDRPYYSNLWILNEDFIYFNGYSEYNLSQIKDINEKPLFDLSNLSDDDKKLLKSEGRKRPDIILFPEEGKCIIIELKAPDIEVSKHIDQTERYARIISSSISNKYKIDQFYSYLIVDNINIIDIPSEYEEMNNTEKAFFSPSKKIKGVLNGVRQDVAFMYSEILQYSDIYKRASKRYEIFKNILSQPV